MNTKNKITIGVLLCSLSSVIILGIILYLHKPSKEVLQANNELVETSKKIRDYYRNKPDYWGLNSNEVIKNLLYSGKINNNQIINSIKKAVIVGADRDGVTVMPGQRSFAITYKNLNKKECKELASFNWKTQDNLGLISMKIYNENNYEFNWGENGLPLSRNKADMSCQEVNDILWVFE